MTIKEIAERSGLAQANIRFYEAEGLITPNRRPNGYRDYSEEDLQVLLRIRLLRSLHIPIEEIKVLQTGEDSLADTLERHLAKLEQEKAEVARAQDICRVIQGDGAEYATLDAQRYLDQLARQPEASAIRELKQDAIPRVYAPWRRFFARTMDLGLYSTLWAMFLWLIGFSPLTPARGAGHALMAIVVPVLFMLIIEPLLLAQFGTTPGKAILGLGVIHLDGTRLTYEEAYRRTGMVIVRGLGFNVPIYDWIRMYKSFSAYEDGKQLDWEEDFQIVLKKGRLPLQVLAYVAVNAAALVLLSLLAYADLAPKNQTDGLGNITVAQFCENYNQLAKYYDVEGRFYLYSDGTWIERPLPENTVYVGVDHPPVMHFTEKDGYMTGVSFKFYDEEGDPLLLTSPQNQMNLSIQAFAGAQGKTGILSTELAKLTEYIADHLFGEFDEEINGVRISLQPDPDRPGGEYEWAQMIFTMEKVE